MHFKQTARLPLQCFYGGCPSREGSPNFRHLVRKGFFYRSSDSEWVPRFLCKICRRTFSQARYSACFLQKRRKLNPLIQFLLCSGVSQSRIARAVRANRKTVDWRVPFFKQQAALRQEAYLQSLSQTGRKLAAIQFDEMETFERSKCLPVSIPLVVDPKTRRILAIQACSMPAKGLLAKFSRKKYGPRQDDRPETAQALFSSLQPVLAPTVEILSDKNPKYPGWIRRSLPRTVVHRTVKGRRGCVVGQGELKRGGFDPLFALNHTAGMIRDDIKRLARKTWCTTKRIDRLSAILTIYADFRNSVLL